MKKIKTLAILILSLVMVMGLLTGCSVNFGGSLGVDSDKYTPGNAEITDKIESIDIEWECGSVSVVEGEGESISVTEECSEDLDDSHKLQWWVDGTTLKIRFDNVVGFLFFNTISPAKHLTVTIPKDMVFDDFDLSSASGNVNVEKITAGGMEIESASGNIDAKELNGKDMNIDIASGDVDIEKITTDDLDIDTASGDVTIGEISATGDVCFDNASGNIKIKKITAESIDVDSASGNIEIEKAECRRTNVDSASGNIKVTFTNVPDNIDIDSATGNITITLPENAEFTAYVDSVISKLHCDFPATQEYDSDDSEKLVVGSGTAKINIESAVGNVNIYMDK